MLSAMSRLIRATDLTGFVAGAGDLPGLYRLGRVVAIASRIQAEGIVVLQTAASDLPVIAVRSRVKRVEAPGHAYRVAHGERQASSERRVLPLVTTSGGDFSERYGGWPSRVELDAARYPRGMEPARRGSSPAVG